MQNQFLPSETTIDYVPVVAPSVTSSEIEAAQTTLSMPPELRKAHHALDTAVETLYRPQPFADDRERAEHLLALYETLSAPLLAAAQGKTRPRRATVKG